MKEIGIPQGKKDVFLEHGGNHLLVSECGRNLAEIMVTQRSDEVVSHWQAKTIDEKFITPIKKINGAVYIGRCDGFSHIETQSYVTKDNRVVNVMILKETGEKYDG